MRFFELVQNQNGGVDAGRAGASRSNADAHDRPEKRKRDAASGETETKDLDVRPELLKGWLVEGNGYLRRRSVGDSAFSRAEIEYGGVCLRVGCGVCLRVGCGVCLRVGHVLSWDSG
eukprot:3495750-Rhodomonas_salina.2